ncbi:TonB protein C-terminal [Polaribacter sp. KT25b]|uniref:energy transducer TonB n=2 Tax=unclassified Polaribacter TaxID=196858 RepID=UPI00087997E9|nr:energy transducer TonB [Polaribacter sp. KT25b]SDS11355.1 TonB protein C-terminal [Polaribacter sp. KT25b]
MNLEKKVTKKNTASKNELTQAKFKKVESKNSLNLEYQLLGENNEQIKFSSLTKMAEFPGGFDSLTVFIQRNLELPKGDYKEIEGKVKSTFIIDTLGKVVDINIVEKLEKNYDYASYEVISKIPDWKPAEIENGKKVRIKILIPFKFILEK